MQHLQLPILITESQTSIAIFDFNDIPSPPSIAYLSDEQESKTFSMVDSDSDDDMPLCQLLLQMEKTNEHITIAMNGYKYLNKICDTLQGELIQAVVTSSSKNIPVGSYVAIKKSDKSLLQKRISIEDGISHIVDENLVKEASILKQLTQTAKDGNIPQYIDFFESSDYVYLVMEYIDNAVTLKKFIAASHQLIHVGKLTFKNYSKTIKCIMYQLSTTLKWLHNIANCCHLDICLENIMIQNWEYNKDKYGHCIPNNCIKVKLCDFGVAEIFDDQKDNDCVPFLCTKTALTLENGHFLAPEIDENGKYDGRSADIWSLGLILYYCMVGKPLYNPWHLWDEPKSGYLALKTNKIREHLFVHGLLKYFKGSCFALLSNLLTMEPNKRFDASSIVRHRWF